MTDRKSEASRGISPEDAVALVAEAIGTGWGWAEVDPTSVIDHGGFFEIGYRSIATKERGGYGAGPYFVTAGREVFGCRSNGPPQMGVDEMRAIYGLPHRPWRAAWHRLRRALGARTLTFRVEDVGVRR